MPVVEADAEASRGASGAWRDARDERLRRDALLLACSMIGAPCVSSAHTKCTSWPCMRWKRTQMSAWMYSMMWPRWNGPLAYGSAVVTKSLREPCRKF
jgi:hypothetical protein